MLVKPFQRIGSGSNADVGQKFELAAKIYFASKNIDLESHFKLPLGITENKKMHAFDLGSEQEKILVECKSHRWTNGSNIPSAKITVWNEAMFYFYMAPVGYKKVLFVLRDYCEKRKLTLAQYYLRNFSHLIPPTVEIWEFDEITETATVHKIENLG